MVDGEAIVAERPAPQIAQIRKDVKSFSFLEEIAEPLQKVFLKAWEARGKLVRDVAFYTTLFGRRAIAMPGRALGVVRDPNLWVFITEQEDPEALGFVIVGSGGALCLASAGALTGATLGGATGTAVGVVPAIFTFGLSIPAFAATGCVSGLALGTSAGGCVGFIGGGACGYGVACFRREIERCALCTAGFCHDVYAFVVVKPVNKVKSASRAVGDKVGQASSATRRKAGAAAQGAKDFVADRRVQAAAAGASVGGVTLGATGAAAGTTVGAASGALVGLVPALFTFGLSIPVCAVVGGGAGLCVGATVGTATGVVGGGALGVTTYAYRRAPGQAVSYTRTKARGALNFASGLMAGSTGGTPALSESSESVVSSPAPGDANPEHLHSD